MWEVKTVYIPRNHFWQDDPIWQDKDWEPFATIPETDNTGRTTGATLFVRRKAAKK